MPVPRITKEQLKELLDRPPDARPLVVDVRLKYPYEHSTLMLPGAVRLGAGTVDASTLPRDREIVLYDSDPDELVSARVAAELLRLGFRAVALSGGLPEWVNAKLPTETKPAPQSTPLAPGALKA